MNVEVGNRGAAGAANVGSVLRRAGRVALWAFVGLLLLRGVFAMAAGPGSGAPAQTRNGGIGQAEEAFAIRFARAYLADPTAPALAGFLAEGAQLGSGRPPQRIAGVAQAELSAIEELGDGKFILTVACELRDSRTLYLAVPIARSLRAGGVAALGAPSVVAVPGAAGVDSDRPRPLSGPDAGEIAALIRRFLPEYVEARSPGELAYFLAPGTAVAPLAGAMRFVSVSGVGQLSSDEGARRTVLARVVVEDPASGAIYPLAYRLELARSARWYVTKVRGAAS